MKNIIKSFTAILFIFTLGVTTYSSTSTFSPTGDIEIGIEVYDFEESNKHKDYSEPYIRYNLYPLKSSPLTINGRSSLRDQYNVSGDHENDKRERHQLYVSYNWRFGKLSLDPGIGFRAESFSDGKFEERNEIRALPIMSYRFNRKLQWYFAGYIGYSDVDGEEVDGQGRVIEEYSNQSTRNIATGFRYRATNNLRLDTAVQHKKREAWAGQYLGTIYRTRINYDLYRDQNWRFTVNAQVAYMPEVEISKHGHTEEDEMAYRLGFTLQRELTSNLDLIGRFYYQWRPTNESGTGGGNNGGGSGGGGNGGNNSGDGSGGGGNGGGGDSSTGGNGPKRYTEHQQFYSVAVRYYF